MNTGICQLCDEEKKLIEAHIIPKALAKKLHDKSAKDPTKMMLVVGAEAKTRASRTGIYDKNILCADCDGKLGVYDEYGNNFLRQDFLKFATDIRGNPFLKITGYDYSKLKLFFISILWRAHLCEQGECKNVDLGEYAEKAKNMIIENNAGGINDFSIMANYLFRGKRFDSNDPYKSYAYPSPNNYEKFSYFMYLPPFEISIICDPRNVDSGNRNIILSQNQWFTRCFNFSDSYILELLIRDMKILLDKHTANSPL